MTPAEFRSHLTRLGLTQAGAARVLGVTTSAVERWVGGQRAVHPTVARVLAIADRELLTRLAEALER